MRTSLKQPIKKAQIKFLSPHFLKQFILCLYCFKYFISYLHQAWAKPALSAKFAPGL
jgi:hypothetical protein